MLKKKRRPSCFPGVLCLVIGVLVVLLDCLIPEKIREAFSVEVDNDEDEDIHFGQGYLNSNFLASVTTTPLTTLVLPTVSLPV